MKLLIASDIHGDAVCCKKMLDAATAFGADKIVLLGDLLYHGPRNDLPESYAPKSVIQMLNDVSDKLICVRGNCEAEGKEIACYGGGFYYANSARDYEGFLPDME